ncbi:MAG: hypothetical protein RJA70_1727 [Pseudomonadota bacterium]
MLAVQSVPFAKLGIHLVDEASEDAYGRWQRLARLFRLGGQRALGLIPANDQVGVAGVAVQWAHALGGYGLGRTRIVDANMVWPAWRELLSDVTKAEPSADNEAQHEGFVTLTLGPDVSIATIHPAKAGSFDEGLIHAQIADAKLACENVLVDLTGLREQGRDIGFYAALDGIIVVALALETLESELREAYRGVPRALDSGILIVG